MTLQTHLNVTLEKLLSQRSVTQIQKDQLIHTLDLTLLKSNATTEELVFLLEQAQTHDTAAICILPEHLYQFKPSASLRLATVVNFPHGIDDLLVSLENIDTAILQGANEIDFVFPYQTYLEGDKQKAFNQSDVIIQACLKHDATIKIIIETGVFTDMESIYCISKELISRGCHFIKTSTGKIPHGASFSAVFAILSALRDSNNQCGIKISGGIKTLEQAQLYADLAELMLGKKINNTWFRIGASSLLD